MLFFKYIFDLLIFLNIEIPLNEGYYVTLLLWQNSQRIKDSFWLMVSEVSSHGPDPGLIVVSLWQGGQSCSLVVADQRDE